MAPLVFVDDILHLMFSTFLDAESMVKYGFSVCKQWNNIIRSIPIDLVLEKYKLDRLMKSSPNLNLRSLVLNQAIGEDVRERMQQCTTLSTLKVLVLDGVMDFSSLLKLITSPVMSNLVDVKFNGNHNKKDKLIPPCSQMKALKSLGFDGSVDDLLVWISQSEYFENLTELDLDMASYSDKGILAIVSNNSHVKNLTSLSCESSQLTGQAIRGIANSSNMKNLTKLNIGYNYKGVEGIKDIIQSENMKNLKILHLAEGTDHLISANSQIKNLTKLKIMGQQLNEDVIKIANCPHMNHIEKLSRYFGTSTSALEESGDTALAQSKYITKLKKYYLEFEGVEPTMFITSPNASHVESIYGAVNGIKMAKALAESLYLKNLSRLHFYGECEENVFEILSESKNLTESLQSMSFRYTGDEMMISSCKLITHLSKFTALKKLDLSFINLGLEGVNAIISTGLINNLSKLSLNECCIDSDCLKDLAECQEFHLTSLSLGSNEKLRGQIHILCEMPYLTSLQELNLKSCDLSDEDVFSISQCKYLTNLRHLNVRFNNISNEALKSIFLSENLQKLSMLDMFRSNISMTQELSDLIIENIPRFTNLSFLSIPRQGKVSSKLEEQLEKFGIS